MFWKKVCFIGYCSEVKRDTDWKVCIGFMTRDFYKGSDIYFGGEGCTEASFLNVDEQTEGKELEIGRADKSMKFGYKGEMG